MSKSKSTIGYPPAACFLRRIETKNRKGFGEQTHQPAFCSSEAPGQPPIGVQLLYKYSQQHERLPALMVQMQSEETKNHQLRQRLAKLKHLVGQKQLEIDFLHKLMELGS